MISAHWRRIERAIEALEAKWPWLLAGYSLLFLAITLTLDAKRPFWNDELFTFYISRQPTLGDVRNVLLTGAEQLPLLFFLLVRMSTSLLGGSHIAFRLPETLGFLVMSVSSFLFVRRRVSVFYGFVAFAFPAVTGAYYYAYEARPYGLVMGFCGLAMLCWQAAADGRRRPASVVALSLCLAAAMGCHYYAVLLLFPFGLAELVRYVRTRKRDWAIYLSLLASIVPLVFSLPLILAASKYSSKFWARPHWTSIVSFYEELLMPAGLALMLMLLLMGAFAYWPADTEASQSRRFAARDIALTGGFLLLPAAAVLIAKLFTGAFTSRYAIYSVIGLSILVAYSMAFIGRKRALVGFLSAVILTSCWLVIVVREYQRIISDRQDQEETFEFLARSDQAVPLVIDSPHQFLVQSYLSAMKHQGHFVYLADKSLALKYTGTDTVERGLLELRNYAPLDVQDYDSFIAAHSQLLIYGFPDEFGWVLEDLIRKGWSVSAKARNGGLLLYLVKQPK